MFHVMCCCNGASNVLIDMQAKRGNCLIALRWKKGAL
uniref:Uncharacterized protein n=1 Tax=Ralstonia solanacearum TaxID=305 RepID=A0A0S4VAY0_RALSL|nr:protein of unknown function [Ralstonia solanacearum]